MESGIIPSDAYDISNSGRIIINGAPPFETKLIFKADGYMHKEIIVNEGIEPVLPAE